MLSPIYAQARHLALVALFAALTIALGAVYIPLPISPVPVTGQTLGVMLAGGILGARLGFLSQAIVVSLVAVGLPVLAGGRGGLGILLGPSGGYLLAWPFAAFVIGWLTERLPHGSSSLPLLLAVNLLGGVVLIYLPGVVWLGVVSGRPLAETLALGTVPFLPGDLVKVVAATLATRALWSAHDPRRLARLQPLPQG